MSTQRVEIAERQTIDLQLEPEPVKPLAPAEPKTQPPTVENAQAFGRSPLDTITDLLNRGITIEQLDQFLELQRKWEANEARKAYTRAMTLFKREEIPAILKKHHVHYQTKDANGAYTGSVDYWHESLDQVVEAVIEPMAKHGLTHKWIPTQDRIGGQITVECVVTHELGHAEAVDLSAMPDSSGRKNPIQQVKSTISYLERITLLAITGLAAKGMDDDGRNAGQAQNDPPSPSGPAGKPPTSRPQSTNGNGAETNGRASNARVSTKQVALLETRCDQAGVPMRELCRRFEISVVEELPRAAVDDALKWIKEAGSGAPQ